MISNPGNTLISKKLFYLLQLGCPVPPLPASLHSALPESPAGKAQEGGWAEPKQNVQARHNFPDWSRSTSPPAVSIDPLILDCFPYHHPRTQNQGCLELTSGRWSMALTFGALVSLDTWRWTGWSCSSSSPGEIDTTEQGVAMCGCFVGTISISCLGWSSLPVDFPARARTWTHSSPQWLSRVGVHSSRPHPSLLSPG